MIENVNNKSTQELHFSLTNCCIRITLRPIRHHHQKIPSWSSCLPFFCHEEEVQVEKTRIISRDEWSLFVYYFSLSLSFDSWSKIFLLFFSLFIITKSSVGFSVCIATSTLLYHLSLRSHSSVNKYRYEWWTWWRRTGMICTKESAAEWKWTVKVSDWLAVF